MVAAGGLLVGCATVRVQDGVYAVPAKGYRVTSPAGWQRIPSDADLAFRQASLGAGLMAHGTCDSRVRGRPLPILARHLRFGLRDVTALEETRVTVAGQPGRESRFQARLDGVPVTVRAVTLEGPRCLYDLVAVAPPGAAATIVPDVDRFIQSFVLTPETP
jgi:hypothetical protein